MSKNQRIALVFGGFMTAVAAAFYPIFFYPLTHKEEYRDVQKVNRTGVNQADIQPVCRCGLIHSRLQANDNQWRLNPLTLMKTLNRQRLLDECLVCA
ncbi:small integral membrane protein 20 isoform X1 [Anarhichas minor]|uniref:small integral membrane protein 20 isoform X1 n=1 Tax=Anarhichas minor TaxID=65739 RepID=UPI003F73AF95